MLTEGGLDVVILEAGPLLNPAKHFSEHVWPYQLAHRGAGIGGSGDDGSGGRGTWTSSLHLRPSPGRTVHQRTRLTLRVGPRAHSWGADEPLYAGLAAYG